MEILSTDSDWIKYSKFFSINENWGNPYKMARPLLDTLYTMRQFTINLNPPNGYRFIVHCGYEELGHSEISYHFRDKIGRAVDGHFERLNLIDQFLIAERFNFGGIGLYSGGSVDYLHLDCRDTKYSARWGCYVIEKTIDNRNIKTRRYNKLDSEFIRWIYKSKEIKDK